MPKGFLITGTDTGVGKTIIAGAVVKALHFLGLKTGVMKPIESGCSRKGDVLIPYDGLFLKQIARTDDPLSSITPCCLESPLAPLPAAEQDGTEIDLSSITRVFATLSGKYDAIVAEGIGGLMVPLRKDYFVADLAAELGLPLIVVARPGLGTINHTMLTVRCALKEGLSVAGIIINYSQPPEDSLAEKTNPRLLAQISPVPVLGIFPHLKNPEEETIEKASLRNLNLELLKKWL